MHQVGDDKGTIPPSFLIDYPVRVAIEEIEFLEKGLFFTNPALERIVRSRVVETVIAWIQRLIPKVRLMITSLRQKIPGNPPARLRYVKPVLPADSPLAQRAARPRIWIDLTFTYRSGDRGGIARVARELAMAAARSGLALPVVIENGQLRPYFSSPGHDENLVADETITYVVVDIFWDFLKEYLAIFDALKSKGAKTVVCVHDIMPLYVPSFFGNYFVSLFASTLPTILSASDGCIAISNYTASKVRDLISHRNIRPIDDYPIGSFPLGANFQADARGRVRSELKDLFARNFVFLSVGTIEPRKGYAVTIDAFELLWREQIDCHFVIIGREGWVSKALRSRILYHPEFRKRLHWVTNATDAEVSFAYERTYCLIQASITEGFGLPVVEASRMGAPILASDNEVFREIAGDAITYFKVANPIDLSVKIKASLAERPKAAQIKYVSWDESLALMVARVHAMFSHEKAATVRGAGWE
ncbi:MAG: glycosyltransferase family 1 protein [Beijerinckiaceae bacterium]|nr:glycosyltransferase family 1 protein [Beijerinckiaceae bacterium]